MNSGPWLPPLPNNVSFSSYSLLVVRIFTQFPTAQKSALPEGKALLDAQSVYMVISFLPLILKNAASAMIVEKVRMEEMADATPSLPRMIWE